MGVYLCRGNTLMAKKLFDYQKIDIVLNHHRCCCMAELMDTVSLPIQSGIEEHLVQNLLHSAACETPSCASGKKQGIFINDLWKAAADD